jgi:putative NADPH-quinone reductase
MPVVPATKPTQNEFESMRDEYVHPITQILLFHPNPARSNVNAAMARAAAHLPHVAIANMAALYPAGIEMERDSAQEAARLLRADRIVLQFPMQWYSTPALMKQWQDVVLTRMGYVYADSEGAGLAGKPLMVAATMGAEEATYRPGGRNRFTVAELLAPLQASANRFAMDWRDPFLVYDAGALSAEDLAETGDAYRHALAHLAKPALAIPEKEGVQ